MREMCELKKLSTYLTDTTTIDWRFFVASSAGYALHDACMMNIKEYIAFLEAQNLPESHILNGNGTNRQDRRFDMVEFSATQGKI